ncbi:MAG: hypothetical protein HYS51_00145 [Candidatus Zambryskibacteria bacterium]|nr:hypothetical protein [Candidatus Zambryskibacteria bacterium]
MKKTAQPFFPRLLVCGMIVLSGSLLSHNIAGEFNRDENDLWLVKNLAENYYKLSGFPSFASVSDEKTTFDTSIGQQVNSVPSELYEFRLIRDRRLLLLRTYGRTGQTANPVVVDVASVEKAAAYGEIKIPRMLISVNQQVEFPLTNLSEKSMAELRKFYSDFTRPLQVRPDDFNPENEIGKLKSHAFWRSIGISLSVVSTGGIWLGAVSSVLGFAGLILSGLAWHSRQNKKRVLAAGYIGQQKQARVEYQEKVFIRQPAPGPKRFAAARTPAMERQRLVDSVLRLTSGTVPLSPKVQELLEEVEKIPLSDYQETVGKIRLARNLQWRAFRNGGGPKQMERLHTH